MRLIMTLPSRRGALHVLAHIATDDTERTKLANSYDNLPHHTAADIKIHRLCNDDDSIVMHNVSNTHLDSKHTYPTAADIPPKPPVSSRTPPPAEESISSASASSSSASSSSSGASRRMTRSSGKKARTSSTQSGVELNKKFELRQKRTHILEKAKKINSLDNSPANDRQLHVLRMVYEEITMYPSEPWIAILAIIIHRYVSAQLIITVLRQIFMNTPLHFRSFKQVKNWFSNERQKRGTGEETTVVSSTGDKYRVRPISFTTCEDWSDEWFEEVVMIHHYRILCNSRWQAGRALSDTSSNYDGRS